MRQLYDLDLYSWSNGDELHTFGIGVFSTRGEAEATARRYLSEVKGFRDYYCEYTVREAPLYGDRADVQRVWTYEGWDVTETIYAANILNGPFYTTRAAAREGMKTAKEANKRQHWLIQSWNIGECEWKEGIIRDYDDGTLVPTLQELRDGLNGCMEPRTLCGVEFEYSDNPVYGFPCGVSEQLFLLAEEDDFVLDGFTIRRLRDIYEFKNKKGMYQLISEAEGLTRFESPAVDISDWRSVFASLQKMGKNIIVENEYEDGFFRIGRIEEVAEDHMLLRHYDADGIWQEEPARVEYREVTSVTFGSRYVEVFSKYV